MSFWGGLLKGLGAVGSVAAAPFTAGTSLSFLPAALGAASAGLGAFSQGEANNRGEKYNGQLDLERLLMARDQQNFNNTLDRERFGMESGSDAWRKLLSASHTLSPGARPQLSPYSIAPRQSTAEEQRGATALSTDALKRLEGGNPLPQVTQRPMSVDPKLLDPGLLERITGYGALGTSGLGLWQQLLKGRQQKAGMDINV